MRYSDNLHTVQGRLAASPIASKNRTDAVLDDIAAERSRQDAIHGGADHDDTLDPPEWTDMATQRLGAADNARDVYAWRTAMIEAAALIVAGIESLDRRNRRNEL